MIGQLREIAGIIKRPPAIHHFALFSLFKGTARWPLMLYPEAKSLQQVIVASWF
jgi:hypothetical protein